MHTITRLTPIVHGDLSGVEIFPMSNCLERGIPQRVLVRMGARSIIPLHTHDVDATMYIVAGGGHVISDDESDGRSVEPGDCVFFGKNRGHGFRAGPAGMSFVSDNGGIVDGSDTDKWDLAFV